MAAEKTKKVKKVTEIPEANVKIEVEQTEDASEEKEPEEVVEEVAVEEEEAEDIKEEPKQPMIENFDKDDSGSSISWKKVFLYTIVAAVIGFLILGGILFALQNYDLNLSKKTADKSIELPSSAPTPTIAEVDKEAYEIIVLNGSGIAGEAATVQTLLEDAGFKVGEIGNADTSDFTETEISAGEDVNEVYLEELEKALGGRGDVKVVEAPSSQTEDVVVTVGSSVNDEDTTPTPTP